jgi:glycerol-3-phosphate dehydrogenase
MASEVFDVVVVGGGVTGCGCALDAATRGLSVALVEQRDYAAGTSSRASKLIHGGVRYLEQRDFALVREALRERDLLLTRLSPHLVHPIPFLYPLTHPVWERFYVGARILLYDTMGGTRAVPRHRHLSKRRALQLAPGLRPDRVVGGIRYYDGQVDDARFTMIVARTAAQYGAAAATSVRVVGFLQQGERVAGVRVRDLESGEEVEVRAREVINATGVWTEELLQQVAGGRRQFRVRVSKGSTWSCLGTASMPTPHSSCGPRRTCSSSSLGAGTGSSAPPTPTGTSTWPIPRPADPTSTTSSTT